MPSIADGVEATPRQNNKSLRSRGRVASSKTVLGNSGKKGSRNIRAIRGTITNLDNT